MAYGLSNRRNHGIGFIPTPLKTLKVLMQGIPYIEARSVKNAPYFLERHAGVSV